MRQAYRSLREGPAGNYQITYRVQLENGTSRYIESRARLYRDEQGNPLRMAGTLLDITDQVEREQRLRLGREIRQPVPGQPRPDLRHPPGHRPVHRDQPGLHPDLRLEREQVLGRTAEQIGLWAESAERANASNR
jgi:hypothetical protein